jgi:PLP dependent protein|tara:strand:+ start:49 stop:684 length:636 start_codon:yes stop_codon:yes gene_type:complete
MNIIIDRFNKIKSNINNKSVNIIAVSKTFPMEHIRPLIEAGHTHFGENKVQEAHSKWSSIKNNKNINLHMIGKLQSNKAKKAVELFDYIHSLDNQKLAEILCKCENNINKKLKYFIQVNLGSENQKSGIGLHDIDEFYNYCSVELKLNIIGLMAIPPNDGLEEKYFKSLYEANASLGLEHLSMGMSSDYQKAIKFKTTFVRIGSAIFGSRN